MKIYWEDEAQSILVREFPETWTWEEYHENIRMMREMLQSVDHKVSIIVDARRIGTMPKDAISHLSAGNRNLPANVLIRVLVTSNRLALMIYSMVIRLFPELFDNFVIVATITSAHQKIAQAKESL